MVHFFLGNTVPKTMDDNGIVEYTGCPAYCNIKNRHIFLTKNVIQDLKIASESSLNADLSYLSLKIA